MARQRPTRLVMGPCIVEIDQIVIRECKNEEVIVKGNFGWVWPICRVGILTGQLSIDRPAVNTRLKPVNTGHYWSILVNTGRLKIVRRLLEDCGDSLVMGPCIVYIYCIVIREVQYQLEVNRCRNEEIRGAPGLVMGPCIVEIDRIVIGEVQYQFEVNRCRNEEIIVKGNFGWVWSMWAGRPRIDHLVIREVQYQFEVNRCRNEEIIVKGNFGWVWTMWAGRPRAGKEAMHKVQYQFEVNLCRNEEVNEEGGCGGVGVVVIWHGDGLVVSSNGTPALGPEDTQPPNSHACGNGNEPGSPKGEAREPTTGLTGHCPFPPQCYVMYRPGVCPLLLTNKLTRLTKVGTSAVVDTLATHLGDPCSKPVPDSI
ncbi:hypothetical protein DPMN_067751 [Dreissena polymorpha]|uniref:Uncharacterized protein n=1 Tax=Dreissena polymorpha TaxID=45954 RepID=A0A9D4BTP5_DREPO|nr:hypothetical protein DPMN_067751 [Dreissena polymorpha]